MEKHEEITELLDAWSRGDEGAVEILMPLVLPDLRSLARAYMARERPGHTLQPTALVHEAYLQLAGRRKINLANRIQLFSVLAQMMRRILIDHARRKRAERHGGGIPPILLDELVGHPVKVDLDLIALDDALKILEEFAPRQHQAIHLSYFGGLTFDEIAVALDVSPATVKRDLKTAKLWLLRELRDDGTDETGPASA